MTHIINIAAQDINAARKSAYASGEVPRRGDVVEYQGRLRKVIGVDHDRGMAKTLHDVTEVEDVPFSDLHFVSGDR